MFTQTYFYSFVFQVYDGAIKINFSDYTDDKSFAAWKSRVHLSPL